MRKIVSLILSLIILVTATIAPLAMAAPEQYNSDVSISASLNKPSIPVSNFSNRKIVLTVKTSKVVDLFSIGYSYELPTGWTVTNIESGSSTITYEDESNYNISVPNNTGNISWYKATNKSTDTIGKITINVPAGTAAGNYEIKIKNVELGTSGQNDDNAWMKNGSTTATLEIYSFEYSDVEILSKIDKDLFLRSDVDQVVTLDVYPSIPVDLFSIHYQGIELPNGWKVLSIESGEPNIAYLIDENHYSLKDDGFVSWYSAKNKYAESIGKIKIQIPAGTAAGTYTIGVEDIELATANVNGGNAWMSGKTTTKTITIRELTELEIVTPATKTAYKEGDSFDTTGMVVKAKYSDGYEKVITDYIVKDGTNLPVGKTSVTISYKDGLNTLTTTQAITVEQIIYPVTGIKLDKSSLNLIAGKSANLTATISPSNATNKSITWESSDTSVATVDANGKVTAVDSGTATITAKTADGNYKATCTVKVTVPVTGVTLDKSTWNLLVGAEVALNATVAPANATNKKITWSSSDDKVVSVDANGNLKALKAGKAIITVKTEDGEKTATCEITVIQLVTKIKLNKTSTTLKVGETEKISTSVSPDNASDKRLRWASDNKAVVEVDHDGKLTAKGVGTATVTCSSYDGNASVTLSVTVIANEKPVTGVKLDKTSADLKLGESVSLKATVSPSDATTKEVTWKSSNTAVATVDANGKVTAVGGGSATITVTTNDGSFKATCNVTVTVPVKGVKLDKSTASLNAGESVTLVATVDPANATNAKVSWKSSNTAVATVDANGKVTAVAAGTATITVTTEDGSFAATCEIKVSVKATAITTASASISLKVGDVDTIVVTFTPADATNKNVTFASSDDSVVTVDANGNVKAIKAGTATITVTAEDGGLKATVTVTVEEVAPAVVPVENISLDKTTGTMTVGDTLTLKATINPSTATNKNVTWTSSNTEVATVDADGKVTAVAAGTATITVTTEDGSFTATFDVTVNAPKDETGCKVAWPIWLIIAIAAAAIIVVVILLITKKKKKAA